MRRIKHNDLTHYFLRPHEELPRAYLASCEKFFRSLKPRVTPTGITMISCKDPKYQAPSTKRQAASSKRHEKDIIKKYS